MPLQPEHCPQCGTNLSVVDGRRYLGRAWRDDDYCAYFHTYPGLARLVIQMHNGEIPEWQVAEARAEGGRPIFQQTTDIPKSQRGLLYDTAGPFFGSAKEAVETMLQELPSVLWVWDD